MTDLVVRTVPVAPEPVEGCQYCGVAKRDHVQLWHPDAGWHGWTDPTRQQIRERMRRNRGL